MRINTRGYGDVDNVQKDARALADILQRQGNNFVVDCIAEQVGRVALQFNLRPEGVARVIATLQTEIREQIEERT